MGYFLSVDGGGSNTIFMVADVSGQVVYEKQGRSSNFRSVGVEQMRQVFIDELEQIRQQLGLTLADFDYSIMGMSGCDTKADQALISEVIQKLGFQPEKMQVINDGILAYYAQRNPPGLVVIAGTGSIVLRVTNTVDFQRIGGWGNELSDLGSGYWIGRELLRETLLFADGCRRESPLLRQVCQLYPSGCIQEQIAEITANTEIASFARIVLEHAEKGEPLAQEIIGNAVRLLAQQVQTALVGVAKQQQTEVVLSGGLFKNHYFENAFMEELEKMDRTFAFYSQKAAPVYGGIKIAQQVTGGMQHVSG